MQRSVRSNRSRSRDEQHTVTFEPSSILKKESAYSKDRIDADMDNGLVAVSDPSLFKFDDELMEAD